MTRYEDIRAILDEAKKAREILENGIFGEIIAGEEENVIARSLSSLEKFADAAAERGHWYIDGAGIVRCDRCNQGFHRIQYGHMVKAFLRGYTEEYPYCYKCGVKMEQRQETEVEA